MEHEISISNIVNTIYKIKIRIGDYKENLQKNEALVRYSLIDPLLRALGWDTENPEEVIPEFNTEAGVPDYALKIEGKIIAFIEAKALGTSLDDKKLTNKLISYANTKAAPYAIATDGDRWKIYDVFRRVELEKKLVTSWSISSDEAEEIALKSLCIANLGKEKAFGKIPEKPLFITENKEEKSLKRIRGPINHKIAKYLVLRVLIEEDRPMRRKEIIEKVGEKVELTDHDKAKTKSGKTRWKAAVAWAISELSRKGAIERVEEGVYKIREDIKRKLLERLKIKEGRHLILYFSSSISMTRGKDERK